MRETIVGIISVNIPILRPLFSKSFWTGDFKSAHGTYYPKPGRTLTGKSRTTLSAATGPYEMTSSISEGRPGSEDMIIKRPEDRNEIYVHTSYQVESEENASEVSDSKWHNDGKVSTKITHDREDV